ncbi:hypothetical protein N7508_005768 [Penicillium antarcticum]|uniref:uncharacterized protein n=1 Tax=Penicillium antarcticum TaxID=416450 RepID=UPI0023A2F359|nr:uncharacterized protein N7508_005768 [Penicillium antarcticum]KAJ5306753.1 hypothetical protein N7508_005768 [Penicillium antarcticum]
MARKPKPPDLVPPRLNEDAMERKRVLNILAQRRYRKAHHLSKLPPLNIDVPQDVLSPPATAQCEAHATDKQIGYTGSISTELGIESYDHFTDESFRADNHNHANIPVFPQTPSSDLSAMGPIYSTLPFNNLTFGQSIYKIPPSLEWENAEGQDAMLNQLENRPSRSLPNNLDSNIDISTELQNHDASFFNFPDDHLLDVPSLTLLNVAMKVAQRLNITELIWDMTAISPFFQSNSSHWFNILPPSLESTGSSAKTSSTIYELPSHLQRTLTQRLIPHHPILDLLPWPGARDKLIQVFNLPIEMRPKSAQDQLGLARLVYDMEDPGGEGVNIRGRDIFSPVEWETGQLV